MYNAKNSSTGSLNGCESVRIMEHYLKDPKPVFDNPSDTTVPDFTLCTPPFSLSVKYPFTLILVSHDLFWQLLSYDHSTSWLEYFYKNVKIEKYLRLSNNLDCLKGTWCSILYYAKHTIELNIQKTNIRCFIKRQMSCWVT